MAFTLKYTGSIGHKTQEEENQSNNTTQKIKKMRNKH